MYWFKIMSILYVFLKLEVADAPATFGVLAYARHWLTCLISRVHTAIGHTYAAELESSQK